MQVSGIMELEKFEHTELCQGLAANRQSGLCCMAQRKKVSTRMPISEPPPKITSDKNVNFRILISVERVVHEVVCRRKIK